VVALLSDHALVGNCVHAYQLRNYLHVDHP
jgi:hypothetical protein